MEMFEVSLLHHRSLINVEGDRTPVFVCDGGELFAGRLRAFADGGGLTVPGALNKFSVFAQRLIAPRVVPCLVAKMPKA
jgi:hypothetical protein